MLIDLWEVADNLPENKFYAVVGMSIAHRENGTPGSALEAVLDECAELALRTGAYAVFSNRYQKNGVVLAELMKKNLIEWGVSRNTVIIPDKKTNSEVRHTDEEARFAIQSCKKYGWKNLVVVANHLHMRRCLAAFQVAMEKENYTVTLYNINVGQGRYGKNASAQFRFRHRFLFFSYEIFVALPISILMGWWKIW